MMDQDPIAIETAAKKLVCCSPQIQAKAAIVEFTEALNDACTVGIEVAAASRFPRVAVNSVPGGKELRRRA